MSQFLISFRLRTPTLEKASITTEYRLVDANNEFIAKRIIEEYIIKNYPSKNKFELKEMIDYITNCTL